MKDFIAEYQRLEKLADYYLTEMYKLQEEFDITLELGEIEYGFYVTALVTPDDELFIQIHKSGYDWGGISDTLIKFPDNVDTKLQELRSYCLEQVKQQELEYQQRVEKSRKEREENERAEYERLQAKYGAK